MKRKDEKKVKELAIKGKRGDRNAIDTLVKDHRPLVISIAKKYSNRGVSMKVLKQQGNLGLLEAIKHYNPSKAKNSKFSTYAYRWVRGEILTSFKIRRLITLPDRLGKQTSKYGKVDEKLTKKLERQPTLEEVMEEMNISRKKALQLYECAKFKEISLNEYPYLEKFIKVEYSDFIDAIDSSLLREHIIKLINTLSGKERKALYIVFFTPTNKSNLKERAKKLKITKKEVLKLEARAFEKLKEALSQLEKKKLAELKRNKR